MCEVQALELILSVSAVTAGIGLVGFFIRKHTQKPQKLEDTDKK